MDNNIQLFRLFLSNLFKGGGKKNKGHSRPSYNELTFLLDYNTAWKGTRYDTPEWRTFWTKLARRESSFNPLVMNSIGAKGYFLLMPYNRSSTWQNNTLLFAEADKLIRSMEAKITADDLRRAEALGLNKQALLAGAWLGGIGGMRAALRGLTRADKNGTTVMSRMKDFNNLVILPLVDPVELYLSTPIGTHIIDNPMYTTEDLYSSQAPITARVDSNTSVLEVEPFVTYLPEVIVTASSPLRKAIALLLLNYGILNLPETASILILDNDIPTITDKVAALSLADTDKMALDIEDAIIRLNIELNLANSQFTHFFDEDLAAKQKDLIQDLRFRRAMNNTAAYGGDISGNTFAGGGPFSLGMPAMPGLIIAQKLRKLFSSEPQKKPLRNVRTDRKLNNLSKATAQRSQAIENQIYSMLPKLRTPYDIQFIPDKQILINGYNTSTNALDSLAKYAGIHNRTLLVSEMPIRAKSKTKTRPVTKEEALGLSLRETKGGALPYTNDSRTSGDKEAKRAFYNANVFTAFLDIPATALVNDYHYNKTSQTIPPLLDAFLYYAQGDYNRGDPNHTRDVKAAGKEAFLNPQVQRWWNTEGKYWFNGTYLNAGDDGGKHSMLQGELLNIGTQPVKLKALGGNLFYDGGESLPEVQVVANYPTEDLIKATIESQWASAKNLPFYNITKDSTFTRERTGAGSIEYFNEPSITYDNGITVNNPNNNPTLLFDPATNTVDDIKLDLLHHYREYDPIYQLKLNAYQSALMSDKSVAVNVLWNSLLGLIFMDLYAKRDKEGNITNWEDWDTLVLENKDNPEYLIQGVDGSLRNLLANEHTILNSNYLPLLEAVLQWLSSENAKKAFNDLNNYLVTGKENYAYGGFKGNMYGGEGDGVNLLHIAADVGTDMIPFVGTAKDAYEFYKEPSWANAGWLALSVGTDFVPFLKPVKGLRAAKATTKAAKAAEEALIAIIRNEAKKAAERVAKLRNTPNINPIKIRRALDLYATYLNMIPERVPLGWAIDRAAEDAAFNYLLKYQMPKAVGEGIVNTSEAILLKALGGPLFNFRTPIESFQGGKQLPTVRY